MLQNTVDGLTIRPGTMDDYDEICRLMAQIDKFHRDRFPQYFREAVPTRERAYIETFVVDEERDMFVAEQDGKLSGAIMLEVRSVPDIPIAQPRSYVMIDTLIVDEAVRGTGIGQSLMRVAHEWGKARGISEFELGVFAFNERAIKFYEKLGYEILRHRMVWNMPKE
jgi:ribosomal protein S18 acetylase RimI-like enzyme